MRIAFCIVMNLIGVAICVGYPLVAAFRGRSVAILTAVGWVGMVLWTVCFSLVVPAFAYAFSHDLANQMQTDWVPEPTAIVPVALFGWWVPLLAAILGRAARRVCTFHSTTPPSTFSAPPPAPSSPPNT
jgi:hypothetical protein